MIREVRGAGLMLGVEFNQPIAAEIKGKCLDHGYLVGSVGTHVLRLLPPLIIRKTNGLMNLLLSWRRSSRRLNPHEAPDQPQ